MPARDEQGRVERVVEGVLREVPGIAVLVVDDGSRDGTARAAAQAGARVVRLPFNLGYGAALQTGYKFALRNGFRLVLQMDGDGQHDPGSARGLLEPLIEDRADVVVGSRFRSGDPPPTSLARRAGARFFSWIVTQWTGVPITDPTSGFKAFSERALRLMAQEGFPDDYPDADVLVALHRAGMRLMEVPARMHPRSGGVSMHSGYRALYYGYKMSLSLVLQPVRRNSPYRKEWDRAWREGKAG